MLLFSELKHYAHWNSKSVLATVGYCDKTKRAKIYNDSHELKSFFFSYANSGSCSYSSSGQVPIGQSLML